EGSIRTQRVPLPPRDPSPVRAEHPEGAIPVGGARRGRLAERLDARASVGAEEGRARRVPARDGRRQAAARSAAPQEQDPPQALGSLAPKRAGRRGDGGTRTGGTRSEVGRAYKRN